MASVRGKRRRDAEPQLESAIDALSKALRARSGSWAVIGGVAVIARGVDRMTGDVDAVVRGDAIRPEQLVRVLARQGIVPRIEHALEFAEQNLVLLMRHRPSSVDLDISFAWTSFEHEAIAASTSTAWGDVSAPMVTAEDLVIFKAMAARPRDLQDARTLLALYPAIDLARVRRKLSELAELAGEPQLAIGLDEITKDLPPALRKRSSTVRKAAVQPGSRRRPTRKR